MANILKKSKESLHITVEAKTEEQAMQQLFQHVQKQAYEKAKGYLIEMHVDELEVEAVKEMVETKKFLYFFLPKEVRRIQLQACVKITMTTVAEGLLA